MGLFPVVIYLALCVLVGIKGMDTRVGFWGTTLLSIIVTPLVVFLALVMFGGEPRRSV